MRLLPPADLLQRISDVEQGLRNNRRSGLVGGIAAVLSTMQVVSGVDDAKWAMGVDLEMLGLAVLMLSVLLVLRSRLWLRESSEPFRYTCTLQRFQGLGEVAQQGFSEMPVWIKFDLSEKLDERIRRLSFLESLDAENRKGAEPANPRHNSDGRDPKCGSQHIEITGDFVVRRKTDRGAPGPADASGRDVNGNVDVTWLIEVTPWVRVGNVGDPATLAHSLPYECPVRAQEDAFQTSSKDATSVSNAARQPELSLVDYNAIIERVYFSLATHIYRQIRADVQRKIDLLPTRYLKAAAYFHEAEDYASSNTLDGLDEAIDLYRRAIELFDPHHCPAPTQWSRHKRLRFAQGRAGLAKWLRLRATRHHPVLAKRLVMAARAEVGYANALLYRRTLAGLSGQRVNPIYEARHVAEGGLKRLKDVSSCAADAPGVQSALFDANVCLALASFKMDWFRKARSYLQDARTVLPARYDQDSRYLYVAGLLEPRASALRFLRQAVDRDERFEVAQFELALNFEMLWRTRPTLERSVGELIAQEYERVLEINPSNVAALGHIGYLYWLLEDDRSAGYYRRGLEYKRIRRDIVTADLDIGLARIAAERGRIKDVYRHYVDASAALLLQGVSDWKCTSAQFYFFDYIGDSILCRYQRYRQGAIEFMQDGKTGSEDRMKAIAQSFVENDYGEACYTYHLRNRSHHRLQLAEHHFEKAKALNEDAVLPPYNLYLLHMHQGRFGSATRELEALVKREPRWPDAIVAEMAAYAEGASREWSRREVLRPQTGSATRGQTQRAMADSADKVDLAASIKAKVTKVTSEGKEFRALVPHRWLWEGGQEEPFKWEALKPEQDPLRSGHLRELGDLHVEALFEWTLAHLALERLTDGGPECEGRCPADLMRWIRKCCWPADFRVLFACYQFSLDGEEAKDDIREAVTRWLIDDPAAYWALDLAVRRFYDFPAKAQELTAKSPPLPLFEVDERRQFLRAGLKEADKAANDHLADWIKARLKEVWRERFSTPAGGSDPTTVDAGGRLVGR